MFDHETPFHAGAHSLRDHLNRADQHPRKHALHRFGTGVLWPGVRLSLLASCHGCLTHSLLMTVRFRPCWIPSAGSLWRRACLLF
jgi:hypothetical protein